MFCGDVEMGDEGGEGKTMRGEIEERGKGKGRGREWRGVSFAVRTHGGYTTTFLFMLTSIYF